MRKKEREKIVPRWDEEKGASFHNIFNEVARIWLADKRVTWMKWWNKDQLKSSLTVVECDHHQIKSQNRPAKTQHEQHWKYLTPNKFQDFDYAKEIKASGGWSMVTFCYKYIVENIIVFVLLW